MKYPHLFLALFFCLTNAQAKNPADYVNPFIGASISTNKAGGSFHGLGRTFPGATTPFGLTQINPTTLTGGDTSSGYSYEHPTIEGFVFTQLSGIGWNGDLGNFLVTPSTGTLKTICGREDTPEEGYRSRYSKDDEIAKAGYYATTLTDYHVRAEATASPHGGILRFTFPKHEQSRIQIDLAHRVGGTSTEQYVEVVGNNAIQGWIKCPSEGGGWGHGDGHVNYTVFFYAEFSKPLRNFGVWSADIPDGWRRKINDITSKRYRDIVAKATIEKGCRKKQGKHLGFYSEFETKENEQVLIKAGLSFTSMEGARKNLQSEIKDFNFDDIKSKAHALWNKELGKMTVEGGSEDDKVIYYTALYHTMVDPRKFNDIDGSYLGGDGKVHQNANYTRRTVFSGWDVFRSQFPLQTIINPQMVCDTVNSLIDLASENGKHYFDRWEMMNCYTECMVGNPAVSVLVDSYVKGIRDFNLEKGYEYAKNTCERFGNGERGFSGPLIRYNPNRGPHNIPISTTLEHAYSEWCLSVLAKALGKTDDAETYFRRSKSYQNIFDKDGVGWFRPRNEDGTWAANWPKRGRMAQDYACTESSPYQQGWFVPHDIDGLAELLGGKEKTLKELEDMFAKTPENMLWNDYYNHANEPVHHVPFLFNPLGTPWRTQYWSREICKRAYKNSVEGLVGNEDVGQMSAWYVLAASGIHPICPGNTRYEITSPIFNRIVIKLDPKYAKGKEFTIKANNNSDLTPYIQSAKLNGKPWNKCWITHEQITEGGILELEMGNQPNTSWGIEE